MNLCCLETLEMVRRVCGTDSQIYRMYRFLGDDSVLGPVDAAYLPGLSTGMLESGNFFSVISNLCSRRQIRWMSFSGTDGNGCENRGPKTAWPGADLYRAEFARFEVPQEILVPVTGRGRHTLEEVEDFLALAKTKSWKSAMLLTTEYHRLRQFLGIIATMRKRREFIKIWTPSRLNNWDTVMLGSQGREITTPKRECVVEWTVKIPEYQKKGDLASEEEFLEYLAWRDAA